jgi:hypothetical protein
MLSVRDGRLLRSTDKSFKITHDGIHSDGLALNWRGEQQFEFSFFNTWRGTPKRGQFNYEFDYWLCIKA